MLHDISSTRVIMCDRCRHPVPPKARFCPSCGVQVVPEQHGSNVHTSDRYTSPHLGDGIMASREALQGERKHVTVLFADVFGSMTLFSERSAEDAATLLDGILELMMEAVHHYEGTVHKTMGDGIMALFGAPLSQEDHALRACYAALRMQARLSAYSDELQRNYGIPFQIRVGLNSGEVVIRAIGNDFRMAFSAMGQTVHLASRMEQLAKPGTILTTRETVNLIRPRATVRPLGLVRVKGLPEPIEVYEVVGAAAAKLTSRVQSAFVGREAEIARLAGALEAAQKSTGQFVVIVGEPGIGKTRLLDEFLNISQAHGCLTLHAAAAPFSQALGYRVGTDILRQYFGVGTGETPPRIREKVSTKMLLLDPALGASLPAMFWQLGALENDPYLSLDLQTRCRQALETNLRILRREAKRQPVVVALDNLQWIESETEQALGILVRDLPKSMLLVVTHRPEYNASWRDHPGVIGISLEALPRAPATSLLDELLGNNSSISSLKNLLVDRAGGNPLFLEECVQNLIQRNLLTGTRGSHRLVGSVASFDVPASIRSLIEARIDRLPAAAKSVLHCAAVIGQQVPFGLLQEVVHLPPEDLLALLVQLRDVGLLDQVIGFPEPHYAFHHALTHDVAYGTLLHDNRKALHARAMKAMERAYPQDRLTYVEQLAQHAVQGEVWGKAAEYLRMSGNKALSNGEGRGAVEFLKEGLRAASHLPPHPDTEGFAIDLREDLSRAMTVVGDSSGVVAVLREAVGLAETLKDQRRLARVLSLLSTALWTVGDSEAAIRTGEQAAEMAEGLDDAGLKVVANFCRGGALRAVGEYRRAADYLCRNLPLLTGDLAYKFFGLAGLASVLTRGHLAWSLAELGEFVEARRHAEEALNLAHAAEHPYSLAHAHLAMGGTLVRQGSFGEAMGMLERGLELCRTVPFLHPPMAADLAIVYTFSGRMSTGLDLAREAVAMAEEGGRLGRLSLIVTHLGEVCHRAGKSDEAEKCARRALELARERKELGNQVYALRLLGLVAAEREPPDVGGAKQYFGEALDLAERLTMRPLLARCHLGLGRLCRRFGEAGAAEPHLTKASQLFEAMGMTFWLGRLALDRVAPLLT